MRKLLILRGLPGSGKSTLAKALALKFDAIILSADSVRFELFSYEETGVDFVEDDEKHVQNFLSMKLDYLLRFSKKDIILDDCHYFVSRRKYIFKALGAQVWDENVWIVYNTSYPIVPIILNVDCSVEKAIAQNSTRKRVLDPKVIRMHNRLQTSFFDSELKILEDLTGKTIHQLSLTYEKNQINAVTQTINLEEITDENQMHRM